MNNCLLESRKYRVLLVHLNLLKYSFFLKAQKETEGRDFWGSYYLVNPLFTFTFSAKRLLLTQLKMCQMYLSRFNRVEYFGLKNKTVNN